MLGEKVTLDQAQERYYVFPEGYVRQPVNAITITETMKATPFFKLLLESKTICFVGDSITAGSENGGYGWYEPLMSAFPDRIVYQEAWHQRQHGRSWKRRKPLLSAPLIYMSSPSEQTMFATETKKTARWTPIAISRI
jgi:hypothetical protein